MTEEEKRARWRLMSDAVADQMTVFTRPYVSILAGGTVGMYTDIGTGTFIKKDEVQLLTCEHVARFNPSAYFLDGHGSLQLQPGTWKIEADTSKDVALAPVPAEEWGKVGARAHPLPTSKFAPHHRPVEHEILFFRGIAGENANYIGNFGVDAIISGYCSQEKLDSGDQQIFEMLWCPAETSVTSSASDEVRTRVKYDNPAGFSGSLVWNTRFVELGCNLQKWSPSEAVVTGILRACKKPTESV